MTIWGWIFVTVSLACVWGGVIWCFRKVLKTTQEEKVPVGFGP